MIINIYLVEFSSIPQGLKKVAPFGDINAPNVLFWERKRILEKKIYLNNQRYSINSEIKIGKHKYKKRE